MIPTFKQFLDGLSAEIATHPRAVLWYRYQSLAEYSVAEVRMRFREMLPGVPDNKLKKLASEMIAESVIRSHFGEEWLHRVYHAEKPTRAIRDYLYTDADNEPWTELTRHRKVELARRVHQFQFADWFGLVHDHVEKNDLSGVAFELDVAHYLMSHPCNVERRCATETSGRDFDLNFWIADPPKPIEVKAKADSTPFGPKTISRTIKDASQQIPEGQTGFLFLRLPPAWVGSELEANYHEHLFEALTSRDEHSSRYRITAVFSALDKISGSPGDLAVRRAWDVFKAESCSHEDWVLALQLKDLNERELDLMAPAAPF